MSVEPESPAPPLHRQARHWMGFLASGGLAFATDASVLALLTKVFGVGPLVARLIAIACAMVVGWQAHRRLTFAVAKPASVQEFLSYAALQWVAVGVNYAVYSAILLTKLTSEPLVALVAASLVAMVVSYLGMRFGVFKKH